MLHDVRTWNDEGKRYDPATVEEDAVVGRRQALQILHGILFVLWVAISNLIIWWNLDAFMANRDLEGNGPIDQRARLRDVDEIRQQ